MSSSDAKHPSANVCRVALLSLVLLSITKGSRKGRLARTFIAHLCKSVFLCESILIVCEFSPQASLPVHNQVLPPMEAVDSSDPLAPLQNQMGRMEAKEEDDEDEDEDEDGEDTDMDEWDPDPPRPFDPNDLCKHMKYYVVVCRKSPPFFFFHLHQPSSKWSQNRFRF